MAALIQQPTPAPGGRGGVGRSRRERLTTAEFITRAQAKHGVGTYDYSQVSYQGSREKVSIICATHGLFKQAPFSHIAGCGCPKCGGGKISAAISLSKSDFLSRAFQAHGTKYDYSLSNYRTIQRKIMIICPAHTIFEQTPASHLNGNGCPTCAQISRIKKQTLSTLNFIRQAQAKHGVDTYDYSACIYKGCFKPVKVICRKHGAFEQTANNHKRGSGCPECAHEKGVLSWVAAADGRICSLYLIRMFNETESFFKVGITSVTVQQRYSNRKRLNGYELEIVAVHTSSNANAILEWEQSILQTFSHLRYCPKHAFSGETECFSSANEILAIFPL